MNAIGVFCACGCMRDCVGVVVEAEIRIVVGREGTGEGSRFKRQGGGRESMLHCCSNCEG